MSQAPNISSKWAETFATWHLDLLKRQRENYARHLAEIEDRRANYLELIALADTEIAKRPSL